MVKVTTPGFGHRNTNDSNTAVFNLASIGLAKCSKIFVDNSVCGVYNTYISSKCRRITCQIGAKII
jgi:hypothetical protein